jgi:polyhydroxyalkanoate synthase subunit PhaC
VPPPGVPDFGYDLRRGCSLVEHLLREGRLVYLVDHATAGASNGRIRASHPRMRPSRMQHWVDEVVPWAARVTAADAGPDVHLVGWSLAGLFCAFAVAGGVTSGHPLPARTLTMIGSPVDIAAVPFASPRRPLAAVVGGRGLATVYRVLDALPVPLVRTAFQLRAVDRLVTRPLTVLSQLDDRDVLAQIEAVGELVRQMSGDLGQLYHVLLRADDVADGRLALAGRTIPLSAIDVPVLVAAGRADVIAPLPAVQAVVGLLTGAPEVRFATAPGGHVGVLTGRGARTTTWTSLDAFLTDHG